MTDLALLILVIVYGLLGWFTGVIRRAIGFAAVYLGFFAATQADPVTANVVLQAIPSWSISNALILGYFLVVVIVILIVEIFASFYHRHLQIAALALDRGTGVLVGLVTALFGATVALHLLLGASTPTLGTPTGAQIQIHDAITKAIVAPALLNVLGRPAEIFFAPVIPGRPESYFEGSP
jgi:uncharacterized membrane protein required for colicin V production